MEKKRNEFIAQGSILAIASILVRIIGMIYRLPMTAVIGDTGNAYYSYAYTVYTILLLLSSYSLPLAVSKMVSAKAERGEWKNIKRILHCSILFAVIAGIVFAICVLLGAKVFTTALFNSPLAAIALRMMAPTILIMALLGVFRGFFQGLQNTTPTAVSQILEQIINAIVSVAAAYLLFSFGTKQVSAGGDPDLSFAWGAAGGALGTGAGAFTALLFCFLLYLAYRKRLEANVRRDHSSNVQSYSVIFRLLLSIAVPVIMSTALYNVIDLIDGSIFSYVMKAKGLSEVKDAIWGAYSGKALLMIHIPVAIASAMAVSLVPSLTAAYSMGNHKLVKIRVNATMRFIAIIAFPSAVGLGVLAQPIIKTLFSGDKSQASLYLVTGCLAVVTFSMSTITNSILQGVDRMNLPVKHSFISLIIHVILLFVLSYVFQMGIYGVIISYVVYGAVISLLNFMSIRKILHYRPDVMNIFIKPAAVSAFMGVICLLVYTLLHRFLGTVLPLLISVLVSVMVYFAAAVKIRLLTPDAMRDFPKGYKLVRLAEKMKLL